MFSICFQITTLCLIFLLRIFKKGTREVSTNTHDIARKKHIPPTPYKRGGKRETFSKQYLVYACPKKENCINPNSEIAFQKGKGFTNPCNHLKACLGHGSLEDLHNTYTMKSE